MRCFLFTFAVPQVSLHLCVLGCVLFICIDLNPILAQPSELDAPYQQRLANSAISDSEAVDVTVAWLRAVTQQAIESPPNERKLHWRKVQEIVGSSKRFLGSPRGILIRIQFAVSELTRAVYARQEALSPPKSEEKLQSARAAFRKLIAELQSIEKQSEQLIREIYKKSLSEAKASGWTKTELESLRRNLALLQARVYRNQALCFAAGSPDSINSLTLAIQAAVKLTKTSLNEDSVWLARIEQLACLRLLKKYSEARKLLKQWSSAEPSDALAERLQQEISKLDLAENKVETMLEDIVHPSMRIASNLFAEGKHKEAILAYDQAAEHFKKQGDASGRFEAAQSAAAIARAIGDREAACDRFRQLAIDQPQHAGAASAHIVAIGLAANQLREATEELQSAQMNRYVALLEEHLQNWPEEAEANTVRLWLGRYRMSKQQWASARQVFNKIDATSKQAAASASSVAVCYLQELEQIDTSLPEESKKANELATEARELLHPILVDADGNIIKQWSDESRQTALKLSEIQLRYSSAGYTYARKLLSSALASSPAADNLWKLEAGLLLAEAYVREENYENALRVIETARQIDRGDNEELSLKFAQQKAAALAALGKREQAQAIYKQLLETHPESGELHESYARLLSQGDKEEQLLQAMQVWLQIEKQSEPAGPRWLRARQARMELLKQLGKGEQAEKLYQLTKLLYPQLTDSLDAK